MSRGLLVSTILISLLTPAPALGDDCIAVAAKKLKQGTVLRIYGTDGRSFGGRLIAVNSEDRILQLTNEVQSAMDSREIPFDIIRDIRYRGKGKVQGSYVFWGALLGAAAGFVIGNAIDPAKESSSGSGGGVTGAIVGMAAGGLGGAGISLFTVSDQKIECLPADNQD